MKFSIFLATCKRRIMPPKIEGESNSLRNLRCIVMVFSGIVLLVLLLLIFSALDFFLEDRTTLLFAGLLISSMLQDFVYFLYKETKRIFIKEERSLLYKNNILKNHHSA